MASRAYAIDFIGLSWDSQHLEHLPILIRNCYAKIGVYDFLSSCKQKKSSTCSIFLAMNLDIL